jgi:hypothetical protein
MARLTDEMLQTTARRVFAMRETTLDEAASDVGIDDFAVTLNDLRQRIRATVQSLPDTAFTEQQAGEGEEVWAAGQVITHLSNALQRMSGNVTALLGREPSGGAAQMLDMSQRPDRDQTLSTLERSTAQLSDFLSGIPRDGDFSTRQQHERFGSIGVKGWLMLMALHEEGHLRQLQELRE